VPPTTTLWPLDHHTEAKHRVYKRYLQAWYPILLSQRRGITYAEGFAGPGEYTCHTPGSPILALRTLLRAKPQPTPEGPAYLLFVEGDRDRCQHLRDRLAAELGTLDPTALRTRGLFVDVRQGRCNDTIPTMFAEHRVVTRPLLAVFDTWGSAVSFDLLRRVAKTPGAETIVTIQPGHFARFAKDPEHYGDNVFGSALWRDVQTQPARAKADYIRQQYRRTLNDAGFRYVLDFELADEGGHLLYLVYGTNHDRGIEKMKDAIWAVDPVRGIGYRDPRDPNQQMLDIEFGPQTGPLRRLILDHLANRSGHRATVDQLRTFTLQKTIFRRGHARTVISELLSSGQVHRAAPGRLTGSSVIALTAASPQARSVRRPEQETG